MPLFTINCPDHGQQEILVKAGEKLLCPECEKECPRVWSAEDVCRFSLKGSGFHGVDYGNGPHRYH